LRETPPAVPDEPQTLNLMINVFAGYF